MIAFIKQLRESKNYITKFIQCDNVGENKSFEKEAMKANLGLTFKYTARETPQ